MSLFILAFERFSALLKTDMVLLDWKEREDDRIGLKAKTVQVHGMFSSPITCETIQLSFVGRKILPVFELTVHIFQDG